MRAIRENSVFRFRENAVVCFSVGAHRITFAWLNSWQYRSVLHLWKISDRKIELKIPYYRIKELFLIKYCVACLRFVPVTDFLPYLLGIFSMKYVISHADDILLTEIIPDTKTIYCVTEEEWHLIKYYNIYFYSRFLISRFKDIVEIVEKNRCHV